MNTCKLFEVAKMPFMHDYIIYIIRDEKPCLYESLKRRWVNLSSLEPTEVQISKLK